MKNTNILINRLLKYGLYFALLIIIVFFAYIAPSFITANNFIDMLHTLAPNLIMISGLAFVVLTGAIDFSVGSIAFLAASIGTYLMVVQKVQLIITLPVIVLSAMIAGFLNGIIVEVIKVNPLITTFGTMLAYRGLGYMIGGAKYTPIPESLAQLHNVKIGFLYMDTAVAILIVVILYLIQYRTVFGRHLMAVGNDRENARKLGVKTSSISIRAFVISGFFAGFGSIFYMIQGGYMTPRMGQGLEFTGIAIVVIGGISLFGGEGSILGLLTGIFTFYIVENGLQHIGVSPYIYPFLRGGIIFLAMYADSLKTKFHSLRKVRT